MDTSILKTKRTQIQLTSAYQQNKSERPFNLKTRSYIYERVTGERPLLRRCRGGKGIYCLSCTKRLDLPFSGGNYLSKPGLHLSVHLLCELYCVVSAKSSSRLRNSMRTLKRCTWHPNQPQDPNSFVSFWRLIRQGFTDSILALTRFLGIIEIGNCIRKSWFIQFLEGTFIQFAFRPLNSETCLKSVLCYSLTDTSSDAESICLW